MAITTLWLSDFRCFEEATFEAEPEGLTVLRGENGAGKTSVLEAVVWLATQRSFRGSDREALVRAGRPRAVLRADTVDGKRRVVLEGEIPASAPARVWINRQLTRRRMEAAEVLRVSVFSPDDLALVQGGPTLRRQYLDEVLVVENARYDVMVSELERTLRQRAALLRQMSGRLSPETSSTLDVWDSRLGTAGEALVDARQDLVASLTPVVGRVYAELSGAGSATAVPILSYRRSWTGSLVEALGAARQEDLRRQVTTVGPHRDELEITLGGRPARSQASQGEQRSLALSLRLAAHLLASADPGPVPLLLLDDVFSELDNRRSEALVAQLPPGQVLLSTAVDPPSVVSPDRVVEVSAGHLVGTAGRP